jgi:hypothetical protein
MISRNGPKGWRTGVKRDSAHFAGLHMYDEKHLVAKNLQGGWALFFDVVVFVFLLLEENAGSYVN